MGRIIFRYQNDVNGPFHSEPRNERDRDVTPAPTAQFVACQTSGQRRIAKLHLRRATTVTDACYSGNSIAAARSTTMKATSGFFF